MKKQTKKRFMVITLVMTMILSMVTPVSVTENFGTCSSQAFYLQDPFELDAVDETEPVSCGCCTGESTSLEETCADFIAPIAPDALDDVEQFDNDCPGLLSIDLREFFDDFTRVEFCEIEPTAEWRAKCLQKL